MSEPEPIGDLIRRVRAGEAEAAAELVRRYEPIIRTRVRVWLRMQDPRLHRVFDSMDICQSVLASFFVRAAAGQYELDEPEQVLGLLIRMAQHKLSHRVHKEQAGRRDVRRVEAIDPGNLPHAAARAASPSDVVAARELLTELRKRLTEQELQIVDRRAQGDNWSAIAQELGGTPDGRRMQLARALDRVADELHFDRDALT